MTGNVSQVPIQTWQVIDQQGKTKKTCQNSKQAWEATSTDNKELGGYHATVPLSPSQMKRKFQSFSGLKNSMENIAIFDRV